MKFSDSSLRFWPIWLPVFPEISIELVFLLSTRILVEVKFCVTTFLQKGEAVQTTSENVISDDLGTAF